MIKTSIQWTQFTTNPIKFVHTQTGKAGWFCTKVSDGCRNCYAEAINRRWGNKLAFTSQNADFVRAEWNNDEVEKIFRLQKRLEKKGQYALVFAFDMTDLFGAFITDEMRDKFFAVVALCPNIYFQILTKRAEKMREYFTATAIPEIWRYVAPFVSRPPQFIREQSFPIPNLWLGVSVEHQRQADGRIPYLLQTPAAVRFLSVEPLLESVDLTKIQATRFSAGTNALKGTRHNLFSKNTEYSKIDWAIVGGESGTKARQCNFTWLESIVKQCQYNNTPCFVKQLGSRFVADRPYLTEAIKNSGVIPSSNLDALPKDFKGGNFDEFPLSLRVREMPQLWASFVRGKTNFQN